MSKFHALHDPKGELKAQPTSLWWRRKVEVHPDGWWFYLHADHPTDPWMLSVEIYDGLSVEMPIDGFRVVEFEPTMSFDMPVSINSFSLPPMFDILAPLPPSIAGWKALTWTGEHKWPGPGEDGYRANMSGYSCYTFGTRS